MADLGGTSGCPPEVVADPVGVGGWGASATRDPCDKVGPRPYGAKGWGAVVFSTGDGVKALRGALAATTAARGGSLVTKFPERGSLIFRILE